MLVAEITICAAWGAVRRAAAALVLAFVLAAPVARGLDRSAPNEVQAENARSGTSGWLGPADTDGAVEVYASATDARPGERVGLHVATTPAARYRVLVYRLGWYGGAGARLVTCLPDCAGSSDGDPRGAPAPNRWDGYVNAGWPVTDVLTVGSDWVSGYYQVRALLLDGPDTGRSATTYLVVRRPHSRAEILVQVPVNTWEAYNGWGGKSLYPFSSVDGSQAKRVSFDRPFAWALPGGQGPLGWELPLVAFLERTGYDVSYQSDVYTDEHPQSLLHHRLDIVAGHDEYWTKTMRDAWEAARDAGVNLAFMGANDAYWQVKLLDGGRTIYTWKSTYDPEPNPALKTAMFRELVPPRLECTLIGIQHQGVGLNWQPGDYTVEPSAFTSPWLAGTGFRPGDVLRGLVSVESDTIPGDQSVESSCGHALTVFFHRQRGDDKDGNADATAYTAPSGAHVFASGSHQFSWGLTDLPWDPEQGHGLSDARLQRFVTNMFDALTGDDRPWVSDR
jgi:hypothetical protein